MDLIKTENNTGTSENNTGTSENNTGTSENAFVGHMGDMTRSPGVNLQDKDNDDIVINPNNIVPRSGGSPVLNPLNTLNRKSNIGDGLNNVEKTSDVKSYRVEIVAGRGKLKLRFMDKNDGEFENTDIDIPANPTQSELKQLSILGKIKGFVYGHNTDLFTNDIKSYLNLLLNDFNKNILDESTKNSIFSARATKYKPFYTELKDISSFVEKIILGIDKVIQSTNDRMNDGTNLMNTSFVDNMLQKIAELNVEKEKLTKLYKYINYNAESINLFMNQTKNTHQLQLPPIDIPTDYNIELPDKIQKYVQELLAPSNIVVNAKPNIIQPSSTNSKVNIISNAALPKNASPSGQLPSKSQVKANNSVLGRLYQGTKGFLGINSKPAQSVNITEPDNIKANPDQSVNRIEPDNIKANLAHVNDLTNIITSAITLQQLQRISDYIVKSKLSEEEVAYLNKLIADKAESIPNIDRIDGGKKSRRRRGGMKKVKQNKSKRIHAIVTRRRKQMKKAGTKRR